MPPSRAIGFVIATVWPDGLRAQVWLVPMAQLGGLGATPRARRRPCTLRDSRSSPGCSQWYARWRPT